MLFQDGFIRRSIEVTGDDLLRLVRVEVFQISFCSLPSPLAVYIVSDHSHMRFCSNADRRIDDLQSALRLEHFQMSFILPCEMDVADIFLNEGRRRATGSRIEN